MLEAKELACVRGERVLFRGLSFRVEAGSVLWVAGHNGAGKTSLLRLLCGLSRPAAGSVRWKGEGIEDERENFHRELLYLGHLNALKDDLTPEENLRCQLRDEATAAQIDQALRDGGLSLCMQLPVRVLSQGQRRRVALTRLALSHGRKLWILDEPFAALDAAAIDQLAARIALHASRAGIVVMTSHQEVPLGEVNVTRIELAADMAMA